MKKSIVFTGAVFVTFFAIFALQKPGFLIFSPELREYVVSQSIWAVAGQAFALDLALSAVLTFIPAVTAFLSERFGGKGLQTALMIYFTLAALAIAGIFVWMNIPYSGVLSQLSALVLYASLILAVYWKFVLPVLFREELKDGEMIAGHQN